MPSMQSPSVGRIVHYVSRGSADGHYPQACRAAIVTAIGGWIVQEVQDLPTEDGIQRRLVREYFDPDALALTVENPTGTFKDLYIPYHGGTASEVHTELCNGRHYLGGTWHWPARVGE